MKVLLIKDVHKLGRAGDIKKVADGYGRNFLIPQGLAVLATPGAIRQSGHIREVANERRQKLNNEMSWIAEKIQGIRINFSSKAGETGKLYGSITTQMIADSMTTKLGTEIDRRMIDIQPIRTLGEHTATVRLTVDLTPEITIFVYREGEMPKEAVEKPQETETVVETEAAVEITESAEPTGADAE